MSDNTVKIKVTAQDGAKPDMDALKKELTELSGKVAEAKVDVDDKDGAAKLKALNAQLIALDAKAANPKITLAGAARVEAQIAAVRASLDHLSEDAGQAGEQAGSSFMGRFGEWLKPSKFQLITSGVAAGLAALPALGAIAGAGIAVALGTKLLIGTKQAQGPLYAQAQDLMAGLKSVISSAVTPMIAPLKVAFESLGNFLRAMGPEIKGVFAGAAQLVKPFTDGLEGLVGGILPGFVSMMKAARPAVSALAQILTALGSALGGLFGDFAKVMGPASEVFKALAGVITGLVPVIGHLADSFASSLAPIITSLASAFEALEPTIEQVGKVLGSLAGAVLGSLSGALEAIGQAVKDLAPSFKILASTLGQVFQLMENTGVFGVLEDSLEQLARPIAQLVNAFVAGLAPALPPIIKLITQLSTGAIQVLTHVLLDLIQGLTPIMPLLGKLAPVIAAIVIAVKAWTVAQGLLDTALDANPIGLIITAIGALVVAIVEVVKHWSTISAIAKKVFADVKNIIGDVIDWVKGHWPLLLTILTGPIGAAAAFIITHWHQISSATSSVVNAVIGFFKNMVSGVRSAIGAVVSFFQSVPGKIKNALGNLGHLLYSAGADLLRGLLNGIESMVSSVINTVIGIGKGILHGIEGALGIGSPSKITFWHGQMLGQGLINGMDSMAGPLAAAASRLAGRGTPRPGTFGAGPGALGPGGSAAAVHLIVDFSNASTDDLTKVLRKAIRVKGGTGGNSVQIALGS